MDTLHPTNSEDLQL